MDLGEHPRSVVDVVDAAEDKHVVEDLVGQREAGRVALHEQAAVIRHQGGGRCEHALRDIDADCAAIQPSGKQTQRLAAATADLADEPERAGSNRLQQQAVEPGRVLLGVRFGQVAFVDAGDPVVVVLLCPALGAPGGGGEQRDLLGRQVIRVPAVVADEPAVVAVQCPP